MYVDGAGRICLANLRKFWGGLCPAVDLSGDNDDDDDKTLCYS